MRRALLGILVTLTVAAAPIAQAPLASARTADPGPGYFAKNAEFITNIPVNTDSSGSRLVDHYLYVNSGQDLEIYDVSDALNPQRVGQLVLPETPQFPQEDVDTNGRILVVGAFTQPNATSPADVGANSLYVIDVEDKTNPQIIGQLAGAAQHTLSCVLDCTYVYGSEGEIVDIRKPAHPTIVGNWAKGSPARSFHDVTEVRPGIIVTSTQPILMLDARQDPTHPKILATGANKDGRFIHANLWPEKGHDKFLLVGGESTGNCSDKGSGQFMTWDATHWRQSHTFNMIDDFGEGNGLPTDGQSPDNTYCAHWFQPHQTYDNGGLVAMGWYEHGTRFLRVSDTGKISEVGYFLPFGTTEASSPYWITKRILYVIDYNRGIDIIKYTGKF
ncbi:MAG: LVIVD repeat-containing protein [Actinomycetota bacterium]